MKIKIFSSGIAYLRDVISELKKVSFPTRRQVLLGTTLVVASIVVATIVLGSIDSGLSQLVRIFILGGGTK